MNLIAAVVADDLTGALDAAAPFACHGLGVAVALDAAHLGAALATGAEVVAVNTGSRDADATDAARRVRAVADVLRAHNPRLAFKKVDSRLKGPVAAEIAAAMEGFGMVGATFCPAIPEFGRVLTGGVLRGFGIEVPIPVAERLGALHGRVTVADAADAAALDAVAVGVLDAAPGRLAVGARGLADALARLMAGAGGAGVLTLSWPVVIGIGSIDPITRAQVTRFRDAVPGAGVLEAPNGEMGERMPTAGDHLLAVTTFGDAAEAAAVVAARFAAGMARVIRARRPASLILSGGETVEAVLRALGVFVLRVHGEIRLGLPWCSAEVEGWELAIVTKSGGFGTPDVLADLVNLSYS